jgi:hypothetical protein
MTRTVTTETRDDVLDQAEVRRRLGGIPARTARRLQAKGEWPPMRRLGHRAVILESQLNAWIAERADA